MFTCLCFTHQLYADSMIWLQDVPQTCLMSLSWGTPNYGPWQLWGLRGPCLVPCNCQPFNIKISRSCCHASTQQWTHALRCWWGRDIVVRQQEVTQNKFTMAESKWETYEWGLVHNQSTATRSCADTGCRWRRDNISSQGQWGFHVNTTKSP